MNEFDCNLRCDDGFPLQATCFLPSPFTSVQSEHNYLNTFVNGEQRNVFIINSALAVPRQYYFKFARFLAEQGFAVLTYDYRGIGESVSQHKTGDDIKISDWGRQDMSAALGWVNRELKPTSLVAIGHSCGGQLLGLADDSDKIDAIISVSSQSGDWRNWPHIHKIKMWAFWTLILPVVSFGRHTVPTKAMGLSTVNVPSGVVKEWASWGRSKYYLFNRKHQLNLEGYKKIGAPYLAYAFEDDFMAPPATVRALLDQFPQADVNCRVINPKKLNQKAVGHFGFFKEQMRETYWRDVLDWVELKGFGVG